jgi:hypothetical protein
MSTLKHGITLYIPNTLIGGSTITDITPGPIGEPFITYIIQQYPATWRRFIDLNDTDPLTTPPTGV